MGGRGSRGVFVRNIRGLDLRLFRRRCLFLRIGSLILGVGAELMCRGLLRPSCGMGGGLGSRSWGVGLWTLC